MNDHGVYEEIEALIGQSAGQICFRGFRHESHLAEVLTEAACAMWESLRSAWTLLEIWNNGTTLWRSPEGDQTATVTPDGGIYIAA